MLEHAYVDSALKYSDNLKIKCTLDNTKIPHRTVQWIRCNGCKFTNLWNERMWSRSSVRSMANPEQLKTFWHALSISVRVQFNRLVDFCPFALNFWPFRLKFVWIFLLLFIYCMFVANWVESRAIKATRKVFPI